MLQRALTLTLALALTLTLTLTLSRYDADGDGRLRLSEFAVLVAAVLSNSYPTKLHSNPIPTPHPIT